MVSALDGWMIFALNGWMDGKKGKDLWGIIE